MKAVKLLLITLILFTSSLEGFSASKKRFRFPLLNKNRARSSKTQLFDITNKRNVLTLFTEWENDKSKFSEDSEFSTRKVLTFTELLEMNFAGFIYHPNLLDFNSTFEIAPEQRKEKSRYSKGDEFKNNFLTYYRVQTYLLKEKPYTLSLFADRRRWEEHSDIFERQIVNGFNYGGSLFWKNKKAPMSASYRHSDQEIERSFKPLQRYLDDRLNFRANTKPTFLGKISFTYDFRDFDFVEENSYENRGTSHRILLRNTKRFGTTQNKTFDTYAKLYLTSGDRESEQLTINNDLTIKHNENLKSNYWYDYIINNTKNTDLNNHRLGSRVIHQWYESLTSSLEIEGSLSDSDSFSQNMGKIRLRENYRKKIGSSGLLQAGFDISFEKQNRETASGNIVIIGESHFLTDNDINFLHETGINPSSIVVYTKEGLTYFLDIDYDTIESGDKTEIKRIPLGRITDGQEVLVDYTAGNTALDYTSLQKAFHLSLGLMSNRFRVYFRQRSRDFLDIESTITFIPDKYTDTIYGCELRLGPSTSTVEYQDYKSAENDYQAIRLRENIAVDISTRSRISLSANYNHLNFEEDKRDYYTFLGVYYFRLSPKTSLNLESGYRWEKDSTTDLVDFFSKAMFRTQFRKVYCEISYEYERRLYNESHIEDHYGYIEIKRFF